MHPIPLTRTELHTRVILQSIAHQINESWLGDLSAASQPSIHPAVGSQPGEPSDPVGNLAGAGLARSAITARDFMVLRVPAHELVQSEADGMVKANNESAEVMATWEKYGGVPGSTQQIAALPEHSPFSYFVALAPPISTYIAMVQPYKETSAADYAPSKTDERQTMTDIFPSVPEPPTELARYRLLSPSAGVRVSPICLGAMSLGDQWSGFMAGKLDQKESEEYLDYYYKAGGNFIDCANNYQDEQSEMIVGEWMEKRGIRNDIVLATKYTSHRLNRAYSTYPGIGVNYAGNHKKSLRTSLDASLKKLRTDYIDILYVHWWDHSTSIPELMQSLADVVREGKVLYLGVSDTPAWVVSQANEYARRLGLPQFVVYQGAYNLGLRDMERDIIPMCRNNGMSIGQIQDPEELKAKGTRGGGAPPTEEQIQLCKVLQEVAEEIGGGIKLANVGMAWARQMMTDCFPILGGTSLEHLKSNIEALKITLTPEQMSRLNEAAPFDHGFPTQRFGLDPRLLPGQTPQTPLLKNAGFVKYPAWP
ncbi:hypothetical protein EHS25_002952 [Saitozyma podzolica]|uniref:NADP-dependent oxidoreductase domain-containing protein n=1 Tax=Saitozyma podzolica TaxID=1890683 RepID=A0A427YC69_9TREE|nr:hypothetical protein EHS25_002952 [Saitozyma podzolica]